MTKYQNLGGNSGVDSYKSTRGKLVVKFTSGSKYTYTTSVAGKHRMSRMRNLANQGKGLNKYINKSVGSRYTSKS